MPHAKVRTMYVFSQSQSELRLVMLKSDKLQLYWSGFWFEFWYEFLCIPLYLIMAKVNSIDSKIEMSWKQSTNEHIYPRTSYCSLSLIYLIKEYLLTFLPFQYLFVYVIRIKDDSLFIKLDIWLLGCVNKLFGLWKPETLVSVFLRSQQSA